MDRLPNWIATNEPTGLDGLARALGVSKRTVEGWLPRMAAHHEIEPLWEWRGRKRVFYPCHVGRIRGVLDAWQKTGTPSGTQRMAGRSTSASRGGAFADALAFVNAAAKA